MAGVFARSRCTVVTAATGSRHTIVAEGTHEPGCSGGMTSIASRSCLDMSAVLAGSGGTVVA